MSFSVSSGKQATQLTQTGKREMLSLVLARSPWLALKAEMITIFPGEKKVSLAADPTPIKVCKLQHRLVGAGLAAK